MRLHRPTISLSLIALVLLACALLPAHTTSAASAAKKSCHWVTKKVHGKKRKVKVCAKVPSKPTPTPTDTPLPASDVLAQQIATSISGAGSSADRYNALLKLFDLIGIGVYTGDGQVIVRGDEQNNDDFYLYDFEVRAMADAYTRGDTYGVSDMTDLFTQVGLTPDGKPVAPDTVRQILELAAKWSVQNPADVGGLIPAVVRDLGLAHPQPYDMASEVSLDSLRLDPVQLFLLEADFLVPIIRQGERGNATAMRHIARAGLPAREDCSNVTDHPPKKKSLGQTVMNKVLNTVWKQALGQISQELSDAWSQAGKVKKLADNVRFGLHGMQLSYSLKVSRVSNSYSTHLGPQGHAPDAGKPLYFQIKVEMQDDLSQDTVRCLSMSGLTLPKKGPVPGVNVRWFKDTQNDLTKYGRVEPAPGPLGAISSTGPDGVATLSFFPKDEKVPDIGFVQTDHGAVTGIAEWGSAFGNKLAEIAQYLTPKYDTLGWDISYHVPHLQFSGLRMKLVHHDPVYGDSWTQWDISGEYCGTDPLHDMWIIHSHHIGYSGKDFGGPRNEDQTDMLGWTPGGEMFTAGAFDWFRTDGTLVLDGNGNPAQVQITFKNVPKDAYDTFTPQNTSASVQTDLNCPNPPQP